jgi:hypothetical protein
MSEADVKELEKSVIDEVEDAVKFADESPKPVSILPSLLFPPLFCMSLQPVAVIASHHMAVAHAILAKLLPYLLLPFCLANVLFFCLEYLSCIVQVLAFPSPFSIVRSCLLDHPCLLTCNTM